MLRSPDAEIFTERGTLSSVQNNPSNQIRYHITDKTAPATTLYYRIKAIETSGRELLSPIVKLAETKLPSSISVIPNPVTGKMIKLHFKNQPKGLYSLKLLAANGQEVISGKIISIAGNDEIHKIKLPANLAFGAYQLIIHQTQSGTTRLDLIVE